MRYHTTGSQHYSHIYWIYECHHFFVFLTVWGYSPAYIIFIIVIADLYNFATLDARADSCDNISWMLSWGYIHRLVINIAQSYSRSLTFMHGQLECRVPVAGLCHSVSELLECWHVGFKRYGSRGRQRARHGVRGAEPRAPTQSYSHGWLGLGWVEGSYMYTVCGIQARTSARHLPSLHPPHTPYARYVIWYVVSSGQCWQPWYWYGNYWYRILVKH